MSQDFSDTQIADFLRRSYFAVDGLWFVKAEEQHGFDDAMALDEAVWDVMSKVQARKARSILGIDGNTLAEFVRAFSLKLDAEGFDFVAEISEKQAAIIIKVCPWFEILKSSGRTAIAETIADRICAREYAGWTREFGGHIEVAFEGRLCVQREHCDTCRIVFSSASDQMPG